MRLPIGWTFAGLALGLGAVLLVGAWLIRPPQALILDAAFDRPSISPNADGVDDLASFSYRLARNATITLLFQAADGREYAFRNQQARIPGDYSLLFSGVVDGYSLPDEGDLGTVERRLLPSGAYTWRLLALEADGSGQEERSGTLQISAADTPLPTISSFSVGRSTFSPNQDGIADRVEINVYLDQAADLNVYLQAADGAQIPISARKEGRLPGEAGRHLFDYEGGIDLGAEPPADGTYTVVAVAQDAVGQRTRRETELTIEQGGKPLAEIVPQSVGLDVAFFSMPYAARYASGFEQLGDVLPEPADSDDMSLQAVTLPMGDMLVFKLTVENYNNVPIRTTWPPPGTVYDQDQSAASLGAFEESGAWRVGIQCETSQTSFPYRWALGSPETLEVVVDEATGNTYYYLPAKARAVVWGAIRLTNIERRQNPQTCWAGLIHEDVEVSLMNSYVGPREVELVNPQGTDSP